MNKLLKSRSRLIKTDLKNGLLPIVFNVVNNIVRPKLAKIDQVDATLFAER